jgi:hypothetical protein
MTPAEMERQLEEAGQQRKEQRGHEHQAQEARYQHQIDAALTAFLLRLDPCFPHEWQTHLGAQMQADRLCVGGYKVLMSPGHEAWVLTLAYDPLGAPTDTVWKIEFGNRATIQISGGDLLQKIKEEVFAARQ